MKILMGDIIARNEFILEHKSNIDRNAKLIDPKLTPDEIYQMVRGGYDDLNWCDAETGNVNLFDMLISGLKPICS